MLATAIILFREVLEAALIIAIVLGASRGIVGRGHWVSTGIGLGLLGASIVAILAAEISSAFSGNGQAILDAGILLSAVAMLTWHNVWMSAHGRQLAAELSAVAPAPVAATVFQKRIRRQVVPLGLPGEIGRAHV